MNAIQKCWARILGVTLGVAATGVQASPETPVVSLSIEGGDLLVSWSGGRPTYQLQERSDLQRPWRNVGVPTSGTQLRVPVSESIRFFRVVSDFSARFEVEFNATWSQETHPGAWPAGAHWSGPVGGVHSDRVQFWREGEPASEGIRLMAERGQQATLVSEVQAAVSRGDALFSVTAGGIPSPGRVVVAFPQSTTREFPLLTLCSMVAPSPDWFVGVTDLSLIGPDGEWVEEQTVVLDGFDAGTDSGVDFTSPDAVTRPRGVVTLFDGYPGVIGGVRVPFGQFILRRVP